MFERKSVIRAAAAAAIFLAASLCIGCSSDQENDEADLSVESESHGIITIEEFKDKALKYGDVYDMTDSFGYDAAVAKSSDGLNFIYMLPETENEALEIVIGDRGIQGVQINRLYSNDYYQIYEEIADDTAPQDIGAFYGRYLKCDNMVLLVTGAPERKDTIISEAENFWKIMGYTDFK